jgi:hypothetical protein
MKEEAKGLLATWADIDEDYRLEFEKWHNCQHMADRVTIPGFHVGYRYQGIGASPYSLMAYETSDAGVMESKPYLHSKNNPTIWTREALSHFRNTKRMIYSLVASFGKKPVTQAPYLFGLRFDAVSAGEQDATERFREGFLSKIVSVPGVGRARLYRVNEEISDIASEEQRIYGAGPKNRQRFLALVETGSIDLPESREWRKIYRNIHRGGRGKDVMINVGEERYWLRFVMDAPS